MCTLPATFFMRHASTDPASTTPIHSRAQTASLQPVAAALALAKLERERSAQDARGIRGMVRRLGHGLAMGGGAVAFTTVAAFDRV